MVTTLRHTDARRCLILDAEMQCALPAIESLRRRGYHVTVGSHKRINMGFFSRYPQERVLYPAPALHPEAFCDRIVDLARTYRYDFVLPADDVSSELLSAQRERLEAHTRLPVVPHDVFMSARDKSRTLKTAIANDVPCPQTFFPDEEPIERIADRAPYPVLVKANISSGARGIALVTRREDLSDTYDRIKSLFGECHIQEYIPRGLQHKADLFLDARQELKAGIVYSKLRYYPVNGGSSIINRTVARPDILDHAYRLVKAMGWVGFADFDFITNPADGVPRIMEINPRLPACLRITYAAGLDFPYMIAQLAAGEEVQAVDHYKLDVYLRYLPLDVLWFIQSPERLRATPSFFKFFGRNLCDQVISFRDPGPMLGLCLENALALFDSSSRKARYARGW